MAKFFFGLQNVLNIKQKIEEQKPNRLERDTKIQKVEELEIKEKEFKQNELSLQEKATFRSNRNKLLIEADIEMNKLFDVNADTTAYKAYRQALRDSTLSWVLPIKPTGV